MVTKTWDKDPPITIYPAFMSGISTSFRYPANEATWDENHIKLMLQVLEKYGYVQVMGYSTIWIRWQPLSINTGINILKRDFGVHRFSKKSNME